MTFIKTSKTYSNDLAKRTPPIVTNIVNKQGYHAKTGNPPSQKLPTSSSLYLHSSHRREMPSHLSHPLAKTYYYSVINQVFLPTSASQTHTHTYTQGAKLSTIPWEIARDARGATEVFPRRSSSFYGQSLFVRRNLRAEPLPSTREGSFCQGVRLRPLV